MYKQLIMKLVKENSQLTTELLSSLKQIRVCSGCGNRSSEESQTPTLTLSNEKSEYAKNLSVTLKIMYISDGDQCRKYELRLKPGEYLYNEVITKIKEKVLHDRHYVKLCKRTFLLVDLFENT